jgi:hypothetical protein
MLFDSSASCRKPPAAPLPFHVRFRQPGTGSYEPYWRLHCEDSAEPGLALRNALGGLCSISPRIRLDYRFDFARGYVVQDFGDL